MKFEFSTQQIELINSALVQQPYNQVYEFINHINENGFDLSNDQLNYLVGVLANLPYKHVIEIFNSIQQQINDNSVVETEEKEV